MYAEDIVVFLFVILKNSDGTVFQGVNSVGRFAA